MTKSYSSKLMAFPTAALLLVGFIAPSWSQESEPTVGSVNKFDYVLAMKDLTTLQRQRIEKVLSSYDKSMAKFKQEKKSIKHGNFSGKGSSKIGEALLAATVQAQEPIGADEAKTDKTAESKVKTAKPAKAEVGNSSARNPSLMMLKEHMKMCRKDSWNQILHILTPEQRKRLPAKNQAN